MNSKNLPTLREIQRTFGESIADLGGTVTSICYVGELLFARSTLSATDEVRRGDQVRAGVSLRSIGQDVKVHPYVFRQICRNGAVMPQNVDARHISRVPFSASTEEIDEVLPASGMFMSAMG